MPASRRGSGSITLPTGQTQVFHTRTQDEEDLPHATKKYASQHNRNLHLILTDVSELQNNGRSPAQIRKLVG